MIYELVPAHFLSATGLQWQSCLEKPGVKLDLLINLEQVCLSRLRFERYFARWWEKYLSKSSLLKHTCSLRDKLIVLWLLNRQAKIFLQNQYWYDTNGRKGIRNGISHVINRYAQTNNKCMNDYNKDNESSFLMY